MDDDIIKNFINFDYASLSKYLKKLSPVEVASFGSLIGILLIPSLTQNEQNSLGNFLELIGQVLLSSASQAELINPSLDEKEFINFKSTYNQDIKFILELINKNLKKQ